jgi:death-on-curing family protein
MSFVEKKSPTNHNYSYTLDSTGWTQSNHVELHPSLEKEFARWLEEIGDEQRPHSLAITAREVLKAHFLLADYFREMGEGIGGVGPKSLHLLQSAVSRQSVSFGGHEKWQDLFSIAATLFFGLVKNHAFHDANKRTALLVALYHLQCHGRLVHVPQREFEDLAVRVAESELAKYPAFRDYKGKDDPEVQFIARFFRLVVHVGVLVGHVRDDDRRSPDLRPDVLDDCSCSVKLVGADSTPTEVIGDRLDDLLVVAVEWSTERHDYEQQIGIYMRTKNHGWEAELSGIVFAKIEEL